MNIKKSVFAILLIVAALVGGAATFGTMTMLHASGAGSVTLSAKEYNQLTYMNDKYAKAEQLWKIVKDGFYQDISDELGRHVKSIDNALQRVKRKLQKLLGERNKR